MNQALILARRELGAYLRLPLGPRFAAVLLIDGILFYWQALTEKLLSAEVLEQFFYNASGTTMIAGIVLSMRLLAEERQMGTLPCSIPHLSATMKLFGQVYLRSSHAGCDDPLDRLYATLDIR